MSLNDTVYVAGRHRLNWVEERKLLRVRGDKAQIWDTNMFIVKASIDYCELENDNGYSIESVCATCSRCGHETESFGTSEASVRRCLALLREECPDGGNNFYVAEDEEDKEFE